MSLKATEKATTVNPSQNYMVLNLKNVCRQTESRISSKIKIWLDPLKF